ncbi:MAG TPA: hypothetical protein PK604_05315 [Acetivibrio clariflavus]|nr:hypothetical protein [Acetivibrio clariflavus]HPU40958.1 hypothetical protein [Acetivibrio clariflavus]
MHSHIHKYKFECNTSNGHIHRMYGISDNMIGIESFHIHTFLVYPLIMGIPITIQAIRDYR